MASKKGCRDTLLREKGDRIMKKWRVWNFVTVCYETIIEAEDEEKAFEIAEELDHEEWNEKDCVDGHITVEGEYEEIYSF